MQSGFYSRIFSAIALPALIALGACDQTSSIGQSVTGESIDIIVDSSFQVSGHSIANNSVQSRTLTQLLGDIDIAGYGTLSSYFVSQFMPAANIVTDHVVSIDSIKLIMRVPTGDFIGDSVAPMGLTVYELQRDLPYPIFSDADLSGYFNTDKPLGSKVYTAANFRLDSLSKTESVTYREMGVKLDKAFGQRLYDAYLSNPEAFSDPVAFTSDIFKGLAVTNSFGSGRLTRVGQSLLCVYYTRQFYSEELQRDSIEHLRGNYFGVTPEVVTNNLIKYSPSQDITAMVAQGEPLIASPAAYEVQMRFPAPEILEMYDKGKGSMSLINSLAMRLPVTNLGSDIALDPPANILMILSKDKDKFFADNQLPDDITSFYATYNSATGSYTFSDMRAYITRLAEKDSYDESDYTFTLTPVTISTTTTSNSYNPTTVVSSVTPEVSTASAAKFLFEKAKIVFAYSKQSINY